MDKTKLVAMSFEKSDAESHIAHLSLKIAEHVVKLFIFPESSHTKGWIREVRAWYLTCRKYGNNLKKGKKLAAPDYMRLLFKIPFSNAADIREYRDLMWEKNKGQPVKRMDEHEFEGVLTSLYMVMSESMAKDREWTQFVADLQAYTGAE